MTRYLFSVEIDCGLDIAVDAPNVPAARMAAEWAMRDHINEACGGITANRARTSDLTPESLVIATPTREGWFTFDWGLLEEEPE